MNWYKKASLLDESKSELWFNLLHKQHQTESKDSDFINTIVSLLRYNPEGLESFFKYTDDDPFTAATDLKMKVVAWIDYFISLNIRKIFEAYLSFESGLRAMRKFAKQHPSEHNEQAVKNADKLFEDYVNTIYQSFGDNEILVQLLDMETRDIRGLIVTHSGDVPYVLGKMNYNISTNIPTVSDCYQKLVQFNKNKHIDEIEHALEQDENKVIANS